MLRPAQAETLLCQRKKKEKNVASYMVSLVFALLPIEASARAISVLPPLIGEKSAAFSPNSPRALPGRRAREAARATRVAKERGARSVSPLRLKT